MANEALVRSGLQISFPTQQYTSPGAQAFNGDVSTYKGPTPGLILVTPGGTNVDLSQLVTPGYYTVQNLDETEYIEIGLYDVDTGAFYPLNEVLPGQSYTARFSRNTGKEYGAGPGTGSVDPNVRVRLRSYNQSVEAVVLAFES